MFTDRGSPVSRRKFIFAVVAVIAALLVVMTGIRAREGSSVKLREWTHDQAVRRWPWRCPTPGFSMRRSICRAGWRRIIARRSSRASLPI